MLVNLVDPLASLSVSVGCNINTGAQWSHRGRSLFFRAIQKLDIV